MSKWRIIETFSGIGAQAKALKNIGCDFEVTNTADWDINAMIAYDLIHNGPQDLSKYEECTKAELLDRLSGYTLSLDGKKPAEKKAIAHQSLETLKHICAALDRTHNYVSVTDMHGEDLPEDIDALTYSFPCQDLSVAHAWRGKTEGISRSANNRSSMLWQIERILTEVKNSGKKMPRFLLMENVPNIISRAHNDNFEEWKRSLESLGYYNKFYKLVANDFGTPQNRRRAYMISIYTNGDKDLATKLNEYFEKHDLETVKLACKPLRNYLRDDYSNNTYLEEANRSQPNDTPSRREIYSDNVKLFDGKKYANIVPTITTKQDRHPNSGVIWYRRTSPEKSDFRYLTPRECLLLMGFDDSDYEAIVNGNFKKSNGREFFSDAKIVKMAGNSIVVQVLEAVFSQMLEVDDLILNRSTKYVANISYQYKK